MRKRIIRSVVLAAVLAAIVLAVLVYVPRTQTTKYEMKGYIVSLDGKVLDEFPLLISVKEYDFVIDRKDGDFSISGNKVMAERDGIAMKIHWDYSQITEKYSDHTFIAIRYPESEGYLYSVISFYDPDLNAYNSEKPGLLDLEKGTFCLYATTLVEEAFIVGVTDPNGDLAQVIDHYCQKVQIADET